MTRENKLALVVGFGLMLFVGILISDHFSTARNQEAADIRSGRLVDPLAQSRHDNALLIETVSRAGDDSSGRRTGPLAMNPTQIPAPQDSGESSRAERRIEPTPPRNEIPRIVMGGNNTVGGEAPHQPNAENFVFHHVQSGESLIAIARRHYGDDSLARELARFNEIDNPNTIRVGHRLRIPPAEVLRGGTPRSTTNSPAATTPPQNQRPQPQPTVYTTYTVKRGDTLSEISLELLGTSRRWREIYELNRDVIPNPDNLLAGAELKIPRPGR